MSVKIPAITFFLAFMYKTITTVGATAVWRKVNNTCENLSNTPFALYQGIWIIMVRIRERHLLPHQWQVDSLFISFRLSITKIQPCWWFISKSTRDSWILLTKGQQCKDRFNMMTSSSGNIFRVTGHLCGEFTGPRRIPYTKASDAELWCFLWSVSE